MARLYANENFPFPVVEELRRLGHDGEEGVWAAEVVGMVLVNGGLGDRPDGEMKSRLETCSDSENLSRDPASGFAVDTGIDRADRDLCEIVYAWPTLPNSIRRAMLALIG